MRLALMITALICAASPAMAEDTMRPGKWQQTFTIDSMAMPDMPPEMAAAMRQHMGKPMMNTECLTAADIQAGRAGKRADDDDSCDVGPMTMKGGKLSGSSICKNGTGVQKVSMTGTYSPTSYVMNINTERAGGKGPIGASTMTAKGKWLGPCEKRLGTSR